MNNTWQMVKLNREGCINFVTNFSLCSHSNYSAFYCLRWYRESWWLGDPCWHKGEGEHSTPYIIYYIYTTLQKEEYGFIKAIRHNDEYMVYIHGNFTVKCASFTDAISKAIMLYFVFHVTYPKQADATYKFLAALFGASYELTNEKALKILGKKLRAKKWR